MALFINIGKYLLIGFVGKRTTIASIVVGGTALVVVFAYLMN